MNPATARTISGEQYSNLLNQASNTSDFVYLGSFGEKSGRGTWSGFSCDAVERIRLEPRKTEFSNTWQAAEEMEAQLEKHACALPHNSCLIGGWLGALSYEMGYATEPRLASKCPTIPIPLVDAGLYLWFASHNRTTDCFYLWIHPDCPINLVTKIQGWLNTPSPSGAPHSSWKLTKPFSAGQSATAFKSSVNKIRNYIEAGDCYQANLSQEFTGQYEGDPWQAFKALAEANPTPYSAFIRSGNLSVLSVSPERFLEIRDRTVTTSPIKGTRPRGSDPAEDRALAAELEASEKDRAENLMIVDLLRNDLGLNAKPGSVKVDKLFALESYRNVHHLVSHIRAELADGVSPMKALFDAFPGGSITGAPKIRAMEIIRELEPHWRGPYCGSIFYRGLDGTLDSNIAIRTMLCDGEGTIRCWGGGGIVADSDPEAEYQETLAKVGPLMRFLEELVIE